jgi:hypothetical protein
VGLFRRVLFRPVLFAGPISSGPISTGPISPPIIVFCGNVSTVYKFIFLDLLVSILEPAACGFCNSIGSVRVLAGQLELSSCI